MKNNIIDQFFTSDGASPTVEDLKVLFPDSEVDNLSNFFRIYIKGKLWAFYLDFKERRKIKIRLYTGDYSMRFKVITSSSEFKRIKEKLMSFSYHGIRMVPEFSEWPIWNEKVKP